MSNQPQFGFAIEYVKDIETATRFYVEVMGLQVERTFPTFVQFEHFAIASDEPLGGIEETELYWLVVDAGAAFARMLGQGRGHAAVNEPAVRQCLWRQGSGWPAVLCPGAGAGTSEPGSLRRSMEP